MKKLMEQPDELRAWAKDIADDLPQLSALLLEAADEIERLRAQGERGALAFAKRREQMNAEIERLRASLHEIAACTDGGYGYAADIAHHALEPK